MSEGPLFAFRARRREGELKPDPAQELAAEKLQSLHKALQGYQPSAGGGWKARLGLARQTMEPPQGLYIYGPVGRGKSMLMDLFFALAPVERKRRAHFHEFMLEVHERLHAARGDDSEDALHEVADALADEHWLLCFDEFQVTNIVDAMILGRLFSRLLERGVVVVATSNSAPNELYKDGLQRERFLPFLDLLTARLDILDLPAGPDYRLGFMRGQPVYYGPLGEDATVWAKEAFAGLVRDAEVQSHVFKVQGRRLMVPECASGVARFHFDDLCRAPLAAADYLTLATHFHTLVIEGIPVLAKEERDVARRFMTLIDALYEHRVKLVCTAEVPPDQIYRTGQLAPEFERTVSRLFEMQGADYLGVEHLT